jgi:O-acetyl-ADP-ribose deacetylase (regulator of RNase III)
MVQFVKGDLLESNCDYICHQVNCQGKMNSGIAKQIREKWPVVYNNYMSKYDAVLDLAIKTYGGYECGLDVSEILLGDIQIVNINTPGADERAQQVINMFAQQHYGYDGRRYTSYDAFWNCLNLIKQTVPKGKTIGFPKKIGCDRGGANWPVILEMITEVLGVEYKVFIYYLEGDDGTY